MRNFHIGDVIHILNIMEANSQGDIDEKACNAAMIIHIKNKRTGEIVARSFVLGSEDQEEIVIYGYKDQTWHFKEECTTGC